MLLLTSCEVIANYAAVGIGSMTTALAPTTTLTINVMCTTSDDACGHQRCSRKTYRGDGVTRLSRAEEGWNAGQEWGWLGLLLEGTSTKMSGAVTREEFGCDALGMLLYGNASPLVLM